MMDLLLGLFMIVALVLLLPIILLLLPLFVLLLPLLVLVFVVMVCSTVGTIVIITLIFTGFLIIPAMLLSLLSV